MKYWNSDDAKKEKAQLARVSTSIRKIARVYVKDMDAHQASALREAAKVVEQLSDGAEEAYRCLYSKELKDQALREIKELEYRKVGGELLRDVKPTEYRLITQDVKEYVENPHFYLSVPALDNDGNCISSLNEDDFIQTLGTLLVEDGKTAKSFWAWRLSRDACVDELPNQRQRKTRL
ncbi:MAG: hypothetical protein ABW147_03150 [Candidatus Thiodiazotropha sp.]